MQGHVTDTQIPGTTAPLLRASHTGEQMRRALTFLGEPRCTWAFGEENEKLLLGERPFLENASHTW